MTEDPAGFPIDLGNGVRAALVPSAVWLRFPEPWGLVRLPTAGAPPTWTLDAAEPLTLSPSIRVRYGTQPGSRELHGHVKRGRWYGDQGLVTTPPTPPGS